MEFEREIRHRPTQRHQGHRQSDSLWWQIALGIFVGQLMTGAVAGICMIILSGIAANQAEEAVKEFSKQTQQIMRTSQPTRPSRSATRTLRPLESDERCINGTRLKRIPGGWADIPYDPC